MNPRRAWWAVLVSAIVLALVATACSPPVNVLTQLKSVLGCIAQDDYGGQCRHSGFLDGATSASTPDGKFVYVTDGSDSAIDIFMRTSAGDLALKGCMSHTTSGCSHHVRAMSNPVAVVATAKNVFVAAKDSNSVAIFKRNHKTGVLKQLGGRAGCISEDGTDGGSGHCFDAHALVQPSGLAVLGNTIAVTSTGSNGLALFTRKPKTGTISQGAGPLGCITNDGTGGDCATGRALDAPTAVALTDTTAFVTSTTAKGVAVVNRTIAGLTQDTAPNGCITEDGSDGATPASCTDGRALTKPTAVVADGDTFYVAASGSAAVSRVTRDPGTGVLTQGTTGAGCISEGGAGSCATGHGLSTPTSLALQGSTLFAGTTDSEACCVSGFEGALAAISLDTTPGELTQASGTTGCIDDDGQDSCTNGNGFGNVIGIATTGPTAIFAASSSFSNISFGNEGVLAVVARDPSTGAWTQGVEGNAGCVSTTGESVEGNIATAGECSKARAIDGAFGLAASADNKNVYVASGTSNAIAVFKRQSSGVLKQLSGKRGCVSETGAGHCADGRALSGMTAVAVTADGKNVYGVSGTSSSGAVLAFSRKTSTGALKQLSGAHGCVSEPVAEGCTAGRGLLSASRIAISPDDKNVYVASPLSNAVAVFQRDTHTGALTQPSGTDGCVSDGGTDGCASGKALLMASDVALSGDGASLYVASVNSQAIAEFGRDTTTGLLQQYADPNGCISATGSGGCTAGTHLGQPKYLATSGNSDVFARSQGDAIDIFQRNTTTGALSQSGANDCVSEDGSAGTCVDGQGISGYGDVSVAPNGAGIYLASPDVDSIAVVTEASPGQLAQGSTGNPALCYTSGTESGCGPAKALGTVGNVLVTPDGRWVYASSSVNDSIAVFGRSS